MYILIKRMENREIEECISQQGTEINCIYMEKQMRSLPSYTIKIELD